MAAPADLDVGVLVSTQVYRLSTGKEAAIYSLPAQDAVVAAHEQLTNGNWNTWSYDLSKAQRTQHGWTCGDFWAKETRYG